MKIILDSSVIYSDFLLQSAQIRTLEGYLSISDYELCIPEVVIEETIRHFRRQYTDATSPYRKVLRLSEIVGRELTPMLELDAAISEYRVRFRARLNELNARILSLPSINLKSLLLRDLEEKRPFERTGKGFRDTLTWETILEECASHDQKIIIVTTDKDFQQDSADDKSPPELHPDLEADLVAAGFMSDRVALRSGLLQFNEEFIMPSLKVVYREGHPVEESFVEKLDVFAMIDRIKLVAEGGLYDKLPKLLGMKGHGIERITLLRWPDNAKIIEAFDLEQNLIRVLLQSTIVLDADLYMDNDEYFRLLELAKDKPVFAPSARWNDTLRCLEVKVRLMVIAHFLFVWDLKTITAKGAELVRIAFSEKELTNMRS